MGRNSTKPNKSVYQLAREEVRMSREKASEFLQCSPDRLERIEIRSGKNLSSFPWQWNL